MTLDQENGKTYINRLSRFYCELYNARFGEQIRVNFPLFGRVMKPLFEKYGEMLLAAIILVHFEQSGKVEDERFPIMWIPQRAERYIEYLRSIGVRMDDEGIKRAIKGRLEYLGVNFKV